MAKRNYFLRYSRVIYRLQKCNASFEEINDYLERESEIKDIELSISKRTFQRDLNEIRGIFNVDIQYNPTQKVYFISQVDKSEVTDRMLEAFEMFNALNINDALSRFVIFEKRKPQGANHFHGILHSIKNRLMVNFSYHKYEEDVTVQRAVEPHALKEFKGRWYLIARDVQDGYIKTFGLDRVSELDITKKKFSWPEQFNPNDLFINYFGIVNSSKSKPQKIVLSFDSLQGKYIKSFPLHQSQETLLDNEDEMRISLKLHITYDFEMELMSYGERVKVISPVSLRRKLLKRYQEALDRYI